MREFLTLIAPTLRASQKFAQSGVAITRKTPAVAGWVLFLELMAAMAVLGASPQPLREWPRSGATDPIAFRGSGSPAQRAAGKNEESATGEHDSVTSRNQPRLDKITSDEGVRRCFQRLWKTGGKGAFRVERAAWIVKRDSALECVFWPRAIPEIHESTWKGVIPAGTVGLVHTHPRSVRPWPSRADVRTAETLGIPTYAISNYGIWKVSGSTGKTSLVVGSEWLKPHSPYLQAEE